MLGVENMVFKANKHFHAIGISVYVGVGVRQGFFKEMLKSSLQPLKNMYLGLNKVKITIFFEKIKKIQG